MEIMEYFLCYMPELIEYKLVINFNKTKNIVTIRVTDMSSLFHCSSFNGDINHWDTAAINNMSDHPLIFHTMKDIRKHLL